VSEGGDGALILNEDRPTVAHTLTRVCGLMGGGGRTNAVCEEAGRGADTRTPVVCLRVR
jgi:hypothetical protein